MVNIPEQLSCLCSFKEYWSYPMKSIHPNIDLLLFFLNLSAIIAQKGSDAWWYMKVEDLLPAKYRDKAADYEKGTDTMDVWFDSGTIIFLC